jgi:hypothetical protein
MTAAKAQSTHRGNRKNVRWAKCFLLPMPNETVRRISLEAHLALVGCTKGEGSQHQLNEIIRATYLSFIVLQAGYGNATIAMFREAEALLDNAVRDAESSGVWRLPPEGEEIIQAVLRVYDEQLATVSTKVYAESNQALSRLLAKTHSASAISAYQLSSH